MSSTTSNDSGRPDAAKAPERRAESPADTPALPSSHPPGVVLHNPRIIASSQNISTAQLGFQNAMFPGTLHLGTAFEYLPLREGRFRLLRIVTPGVYPCCILEEFDLDDAPPYAALSYAWGLPVTTRAIFCMNPGSNNASFSISEHVLEALNSLFGHVPRRQRIWIDAICIDQRNPTEKAHQIAAMPRIYSQAQQVLCWLGAEADRSDVLIDSLPIMAEWSRQLGTKIRANPGDHGHLSTPLPGEQLWLDMIRFFLRPWFHRLWVVQEILMARKLVLICGSKAIEWDALVAAATKLSLLHIGADNPPLERQYHCGMKGIFELGQWRAVAGGALINGLGQSEFVRILLWGCQRQVTEPVDRIWALIGLSQPELRKSVAPLVDYSPTARSNFLATFKAFVRAFLLQDERLWMLSLAAVAPGHESLPSWCPNFYYCTDDWQRGLLQLDVKHYNAGYSDTEPLNPSIRISPANDHLTTRGFFIDRVQYVRTIKDPENIELRLPFDTACLEVAFELYNDHDKALEAHSRTIIADLRAYVLHSEGGEEISTADLIRVYARWHMKMEDDPVVASLSPEDMKAISRFKSLAAIATRRCYIGTADGRVGLAPREADVGDLICILYGANTPYLVRPKGSGNPMTLIGDAYVHGLMYGEALSMPERQSECEIVIS